MNTEYYWTKYIPSFLQISEIPENVAIEKNWFDFIKDFYKSEIFSI